MAATTAAARTGTFAGYAGDEASSESDTAQAPFFVSGDVAERVDVGTGLVRPAFATTRSNRSRK